MNSKRTRKAQPLPVLQTWVLALDPIDNTLDTGSSFIYLVRETPRALGKAIIQAGNALAEAGYTQENYLVTFISDFDDFVDARKKYTEAEHLYAAHSIFDIIEQSEEWRKTTQDRAAVPFLEFTKEMSEYMHEGITAVYMVDKVVKSKAAEKPSATSVVRKRTRNTAVVAIADPEPPKVAIRVRHRPTTVTEPTQTVRRRVRQ